MMVAFFGGIFAFVVEADSLKTAVLVFGLALCGLAWVVVASLFLAGVLP